MSSKLFEIQLNLEPGQIHRLHNGKTVQLRHAQLMTGMPIRLKKRKVNRIIKAHQDGRGVRLNFDPEEAKMQGGAFWDVLKNIGSFIRDKVFTNQIYKDNIAPLIRQGLNSGVDALSAAAAAEVPFLAPAVNTLGKAAVSKVGEVSGAYGLRRKPRRGIGGALRKGSAMDPALPLQDFSKPDYSLTRGRVQRGSKEAMEWAAMMREKKAKKRASGGSFVPAGY